MLARDLFERFYRQLVSSEEAYKPVVRGNIYDEYDPRFRYKQLIILHESSLRGLIEEIAKEWFSEIDSDVSDTLSLYDSISFEVAELDDYVTRLIETAKRYNNTLSKQHGIRVYPAILESDHCILRYGFAIEGEPTAVNKLAELLEQLPNVVVYQGKGPILFIYNELHDTDVFEALQLLYEHLVDRKTVSKRDISVSA